MTRQQRRLVETLVGQRTIWVDGVAVGVGGMESRGTPRKGRVSVTVAKSLGKIGVEKSGPIGGRVNKDRPT